MSFFNLNWLKKIIRRIFKLPSVLKPTEKWGILVLFLIIVMSATWSSVWGGGINAAYGGTYTEGFVGQPRFINPILANSDADQSLVKLIYSGLIKNGPNGTISPDLADEWESADDDKTYTIHLRSDVNWHDGQHFNADDVIFTINVIKDPAIKSPYYDYWKDVAVAKKDDQTVVFTLKNPSPTFLSFLDIGILPKHLGKNNLNSSFIGTGPYKYSKVRMDSGGIEYITLRRNPKWYENKTAYIDTVEFWFYNSFDEAKSAFNSHKILALAGGNDQYANQYSLTFTKQLVIFLNTQSQVLNQTVVRQKMLQSDNLFSPALNLKLTLDKSLKDNKDFKNLISSWKARGINVAMTAVSLEEIKSLLPKRDYDLLLLPVDYGAQPDYYAYWHSSQADASGLNFSRLKDDNVDKQITDYRRSASAADRLKLAATIQKSIDGLAAAKTVSVVTFDYAVNKNVHVIPAKLGKNSADRFDTFDKWYIKTRR